MNSPKALLLATALAAAAWSAPVAATPWAESGDAGALLPGAQVVSAGTTSISGSLSPAADQDLYAFTWGGGALTLVTGGLLDTQLFIFNSMGVIVGANDDDGPGALSLLNGPLAAGLYYLGITSFNSDPLNAAGQDIEDAIGSGGSTAFQPGACSLALADCTLASWRSEGAAGAYTISFSTPTAGAVPAPATLALAGLGLLALGLARRKA